MVKHFRELRVYRDAYEAAETQSWLEFALRCGYITQVLFDELDPIYEHISGGLVKMMDRADQWCISSSQVREDEEEYEASESLTYPHTHTLTNMGEKA